VRRYLYKITNTINSKIYIGIHRSKLASDHYMGSGTALKNAFKKYGKENFVKDILEYFESDQEMFDREREIVNESFIKDDNAYNLIIGGKGVGYGENHPLFGKKRPKHSEFMKIHSPTKGKPLAQSIKDAISKANKGRKHTPEVNKRKGQSGDKNYFFGKATAKGKKWINNGVESKLVDCIDNYLELGWNIGRISISEKKVMQYDKDSRQFIKEYNSLKEAGIESDTSPNSISRCCSGKLKSAGGYFWSYK